MIVGAAARDDWRWAAHHLYALLILTPLVLGMTYFGLGRLVDDHPEVNLSPAQSVACAVAMVAVLVALSLSRASVEIYHAGRAEILFDTLPVPVDTHLYAALIHRAARVLFVAVAAIVARRILGGGGLASAGLLLASLLFVSVLALTEMLAAIEWIHWEHRRARGAFGIALIAVAVGAVAGGLLLLSIIRPDRLRVAGGAVAGWGLPEGLATDAVLITALITALFFFVRQAHRKWRADDMEYARRLDAGARRRSFFGTRVRRRLGPAATAALLARDLQLTMRAFSSAVYVVAGLGVLWVVALVAALTTGMLPSAQNGGGDWFAMTWLPGVMAVKMACVCVTATLGALLPVLVAYQLPHLWLERATGATGAQLWRSKLWYTRLISAPTPLVVWAAGVVADGVPLSYAPALLVECVWIWWLVSTLVGLFAFEMPEQPGLAIVLMEVMGLALGFGTALMWPAGLLLYAFGIRELSMRGQVRAAYRLLKEED